MRVSGKLAETEGFEPSVPISGYAHLANECLQPLGHVSEALARLAGLCTCGLDLTRRCLIAIWFIYDLSVWRECKVC